MSFDDLIRQYDLIADWSNFDHELLLGSRNTFGVMLCRGRPKEREITFGSLRHHIESDR